MATRRKTSDQVNLLVPHSAGYAYSRLPSLTLTSLFPLCTQYTPILYVDFKA